MKQISLKDNRKLSYQEYGDPNGFPVLFFHGFPGSRLDIEIFDMDLQTIERGIRLISIDRPGYGYSDNYESRTLANWHIDIEQFTGQLKLENFSILGYSGGGPYAIACSKQIKTRLLKVVVVSGMVPYNSPYALKGISMKIPKTPSILRGLIFSGMSNMIKNNPEKLISSMAKTMAKCDIELLNQDGTKTAFITSLKESINIGNKGAGSDAIIYRNNWDIDIKSSGCHVHVFHGQKDTNVKVESVRSLCNDLSNCSLEEFNDEGHLSLMYNYKSKILDLLLP